MRRTSRLSPVLLVTAFLAVAAGVSAAHADTIYLKNGRTIDTASAKIEGDRVLFLQFGHPVAIPLSEVDRVEENDRSGPDPTPVTEPPPRPATTSVPTSSGADARANDPEQDKEYWQNRVRAINAEAEQLDMQLKQLRRVERAFLFSHRSTADTRRQIEQVQARIDANEQALPDLRREARRKGIPPGWLRLPRTG